MSKASSQNDLTSHFYDIGELWEKLQRPLTSTRVERRVQGTLLLTRVLTSHLPKDMLNSQQLNVVVEFYAARLKDHHNVMIPPEKGKALKERLVHLDLKGAPAKIAMTAFTPSYILCNAQKVIPYQTQFQMHTNSLRKTDNFGKIFLGAALESIVKLIKCKFPSSQVDYQISLAPERVSRLTHMQRLRPQKRQGKYIKSHTGHEFLYELKRLELPFLSQE
uniref:MMS19_N domain-containing protein n=1 Tax=Glossina pallidipes TaxID=7398 RepID=A0A1A9ZY92_GLOPL